jgi:predicted dehydrogenase
MSKRNTRRGFLQSSTKVIVGAATVPYFAWQSRTAASESQSANDRPVVGCIGNGGMGSGDARAISKFGDIVALCDVDRNRSDKLNQDLCGGKAAYFEDYRKLLDRKDIQLVTISTPDHWHTKIAIDALRAGKDIYCQKPLTLTIDEGKLLRKTLAETGRVFQVGTQQRSSDGFQKAIGLARQGRIGKITRVTVAIGGAPSGGPFETKPVPANLNWDRWLGQAPWTEYMSERCHNTFRWWYEYSGGKLTDWGAHHVDIAQWGIGMENSGPLSIEVLEVEHPVAFEKGYPTVKNSFNTATKFKVLAKFSNGVEMIIRESADDLGFDNGVLFEGENGRFFVNRGKLTGAPVEELKNQPLPDAVMTELRKGKDKDSHMGNFIACVKDRSTPISDVPTHHRILTTCHLANIAMRLGRTLKWNPETEQIVGDDEANAWQKRTQRAGYEVA